MHLTVTNRLFVNTYKNDETNEMHKQVMPV